VSKKVLFSGLFCFVVWWKFTSIIVVLAATIIKAASTPEMSVNFYQPVWCNNPENSHLQ
jgi:hypothetical protein